jgi:hypothetical protein
MSNTISSNMITSAAPSIAQNEQREVGDEIRYLGFGQAPLSVLIKGQILDQKTGKMKETGGLISKRPVKNIRYEMFSRSPRPYKFTVASGTEIESGGVVLTSVNGLMPRMTLYNPRNKTGCRIEIISTLTVTGASVGATTFSCVAGDTLVVGATAIKAGSTDAIIVNGTDDQNFNTLQFSRLGVSIDWVMEKIKAMAGGERFTREKMYLLWEYLGDWERTAFLSDMSASYASKNTTTGVQTGFTTEEFPTTKGLINLAANGYDMQGVTTLEKLRRQLPQNMGDIVNDNSEYLCFLGNDYYARIQELMSANHVNMEPEGILAKFGIKSEVLITSGPKLKLVKHALFNVAGLDNTMLIVDPANIGYVHLEGFDVKPNNAIQTKATHGTQDELVSYAGIETLDAGKTITFVTNGF